MKKNIISKALLGVLICSTLIPAAASSKYYSKQKFNVNLGANQKVTDLGAHYCGSNGIEIKFDKITHSRWAEIRAIDEKGNVLTKGWRRKEDDGFTHIMSFSYPMSDDEDIHVQMRNYYNTKKVINASGTVWYKK